jgi:hypothetical protein
MLGGSPLRDHRHWVTSDVTASKYPSGVGSPVGGGVKLLLGAADIKQNVRRGSTLTHYPIICLELPGRD